MSTYSEYAYHILTSPSLIEKLLPPPPDLEDDAKEISARKYYREIPSLPAREKKLQPTNEKMKIPRLEHLNNPRNVGITLHHFANHELMAIELFAWAILSFPQAARGIRRGFLKSLEEEQNHLKLYLQRMEALGVGFGDRPLNQLFWKQIPHMQTLERFTCILSISFEGANLDFSLIYRQTFLFHGDVVSAAIMESIYRDEIQHVKRGLSVLRKSKPSNISEWEYYTTQLASPFTPRRAKAYFFVPETRKLAGFSSDFIENLANYKDECYSRVSIESLQKVGIYNSSQLLPPVGRKKKSGSEIPLTS